ncbi:Pyridoxal-dependent decarboxylase C-terminal sheet domain-containing protein [Phytophthora infestans]|uniref:Pyridoxal-dependent decarboxylase C-terminal sheet domain-containing protein n=1 Tax=Phytophthora infestans TaxID=4787 RepID=A0A8S9UE97_PHYIN|nr:Pyridoxal-dependent decarboxylase C-terminal sheet domain-containing protein [Phytophthora infestans]
MLNQKQLSTLATRVAKVNSPRVASPPSDSKRSPTYSSTDPQLRQRPEELEQLATELRDQVADTRPELLPLLKSLPTVTRPWNLQKPSDAVALSALLQDRLLCLPELNRNSPCYSARDLVLLYTKLKYLETFSQSELAEYANTVASSASPLEAAAVVRIRQEEVRVVRQLATVGNTTELFSRLATLLHIPCHGDAWNEIVKFAANALPFAEQTESLLVRGSDDRSALCPLTKTNNYNASTIPLATDVARGSCTCSSITLQAFERCEKLRQELLLNSLSINPNAKSSSALFNTKMRAVRARIASCLDVSDLVADNQLRILLSPSGTDAELLATVAGLARLYSGLGEEENLPGGVGPEHCKVTSIITAGGEIGRGSNSASGGKHFSNLTPSGEAGTAGQPLRKFPIDLVDVVTMPARDDNGDINRIDDDVRELVQERLDRGGGVVLLHVVVGAKTGYACPSMPMVDALAVEYPYRLLVVVDACQMRIDRSLYREWATKGYVVLTTGSKFFGGSPFCGAVLMPMRCVYEMEAAAVERHSEVAFPLGLEDYFSRYDMPESMRNIRARLGTNMNAGLLLRWETALVNMEPYCCIPPKDIAAICKLYMNTCRTKMQSMWGHMVELLTPPEPTENDGTSTVTPMDTIVSFKVRHENGGFLDMAALKALHTLLSKDLSGALPDDALAKKRCLLGQPVSLGKSGAVIRIAVGADMVNDVYVRGKGESDFAAAIEPLSQDDDAVLNKIALILRHWKLLHHKYIEECVESTPLEPLKPLSDWDFSVKDAQVARVVQHMIEERVLANEDQPEDETKLAVVYDLDAIDMAFQALLTSFPVHFEHRFAMKSCPLSFFIKRAIENDVGLECASIVEVKHALRLGCPPHRIVFDSPCKTRRDLQFAIIAGVEVNADNFDELDIIREHAEAIFQSSFPECTPRYAGNLPRIGLRINPLLGAGANSCLSVSTVQSKFGVPLTVENRARIIASFCANPWMTGLHAHVGSQGCSLEMLSQGAVVLSELANEIDAAAGTSRIKVLNIGGGLSTNFDDEEVSPTFAEYVEVLRREAPQLFKRTGRTILTEFGSSVSSKTGWVVSEVEYVKAHPQVDGDDLTQTAIIHAGSDLFLRACYRPELFARRMSVYNPAGLVSMAQKSVQNVAGPLCFGGDMVGRRVELPTISQGDFVVVHDTGANTMSMFSRHCSRPAPAVFGYRASEDEVSLQLLKAAETPEQVMSFWG